MVAIQKQYEEISKQTDKVINEEDYANRLEKIYNTEYKKPGFFESLGIGIMPNGILEFDKNVFMGARLFNRLIGPLGSKELDYFLTQDIQEIELAQAEAQKKLEKASGFNKFVAGGVGGATAMLPTIVAGGALGGVTGETLGTAGKLNLSAKAVKTVTKVAQLTPFFLYSIGGYAREAELEGANELQQGLYGLLGATVETVTEMPFMNRWITGSSSFITKKFLLSGAKSAAKIYGAIAIEFAFDMLGEGFQETITDPMTSYGKKLIYKPDEQYTWSDLLKSARDSGLYGGVSMGLIMSAFGMPGKIKEFKSLNESVGNAKRMAKSLGGTEDDARTMAGKIIDNYQKNGTLPNDKALDKLANKMDDEIRKDPELQRQINKEKSRETGGMHFTPNRQPGDIINFGSIGNIEIISDDGTTVIAKKQDGTQFKIGKAMFENMRFIAEREANLNEKTEQASNAAEQLLLKANEKRQQGQNIAQPQTEQVKVQQEPVNVDNSNPNATGKKEETNTSVYNQGDIIEWQGKQWRVKGINQNPVYMPNSGPVIEVIPADDETGFEIRPITMSELKDTKLVNVNSGNEDHGRSNSTVQQGAVNLNNSNPQEMKTYRVGDKVNLKRFGEVTIIDDSDKSVIGIKLPNGTELSLGRTAFNDLVESGMKGNAQEGKNATSQEVKSVTSQEGKKETSKEDKKEDSQEAKKVIKGKRYKGNSTDQSFSVSINGDNIEITEYTNNKVGDKYNISLKDYLSKDSEYKRRKYIYDMDVNKVKSEELVNPGAASRNLDTIHKAVKETLQENGLYVDSFSETVWKKEEKRNQGNKKAPETKEDVNEESIENLLPDTLEESEKARILKHYKALLEGAKKAGVNINHAIKLVSKIEDEMTDKILEQHGYEKGTKAYIAGKTDIKNGGKLFEAIISIAFDPNRPVSQEVVHEYAEIWNSLWKKNNPESYNAAVDFLVRRGLDRARAEEHLTEILTDYSLNEEIDVDLNKANANFFKKMLEGFKAWLKTLLKRISYFRLNVLNNLSSEIKEQAENFASGKWELAFAGLSGEMQDERYSTDIGYHAGDLGKAEHLGRQRGSNRDTGHFGTGTYFVGDKEKINVIGYKDRPVHAVDFSKYNLFKPKTLKDGNDLHSALKYINYYHQYADLKSIDEEDISNLKYGEPDEVIEVLKKYEKDAANEFKEETGMTFEDYLKVDKVPYAVRNYIDHKVDRYKYLNNRIETAKESQEKALSVFSNQLGIDRKKSLKLINDIYKDIKAEHYEDKSDSASTRFMKALGYEGIDVRHLKQLDNTGYGSVIYDLKGKSDIENKKYMLNDMNEYDPILETYKKVFPEESRQKAYVKRGVKYHDIEIFLPTKPSEELIKRMKDEGFKAHKYDEKNNLWYWYKKYSDSDMKFAQGIIDEINGEANTNAESITQTSSEEKAGVMDEANNKIISNNEVTNNGNSDKIESKEKTKQPKEQETPEQKEDREMADKIKQAKELNKNFNVDILRNVEADNKLMENIKKNGNDLATRQAIKDHVERLIAKYTKDNDSSIVNIANLEKHNSNDNFDSIYELVKGDIESEAKEESKEPEQTANEETTNKLPEFKAPKNVAELKKFMQPGMLLTFTAPWSKDVMYREVSKVQGNNRIAFWQNKEHTGDMSWLDIKPSDVEFIEDGFKTGDLTYKYGYNGGLYAEGTNIPTEKVAFKNQSYNVKVRKDGNITDEKVKGLTYKGLGVRKSTDKKFYIVDHINSGLAIKRDFKTQEEAKDFAYKLANVCDMNQDTNAIAQFLTKNIMETINGRNYLSMDKLNELYNEKINKEGETNAGQSDSAKRGNNANDKGLSEDGKGKNQNGISKTVQNNEPKGTESNGNGNGKTGGESIRRDNGNNDKGTDNRELSGKVPGGTASTDDSKRDGRGNTEQSSTGAGNFRITDDTVLYEGGKKTRFRNNVEAIKLIKKLEAEGRQATKEEQQVLAKFVGWGQFAEVFDTRGAYDYDYKTGKRNYVEYPNNPEWAKEWQELRNLLTEEEYKSAAASKLNAHYTDINIIKHMYNMLERFGFKGGNILEPSMGAGYFFGLLPNKMVKKSTKLFGVELDPITGKIAKQLYPNADIRISGFEKVDIPNNYMDVAIGNVPFGEYVISDNKYTKYITERIHNYFFVKALDKVKPGGLVMFITSEGTMNAGDEVGEKVRMALSSKADLITAIRLPGGAFKSSANTSVTTDIIVLRKRFDSEISNGIDWIKSNPVEFDYKGITRKELVNDYFINHPENVLGKPGINKLYGRGYAVEPDGRDLNKAIRDIIDKLPENIYSQNRVKTEPLTSEEKTELLKQVKEGSYFVDKGKLYQKKKNDIIEITENIEKIKSLIDVRNAAKDVLISMNFKNEPDAVVKRYMDLLNKAYDKHVKKYGHLKTVFNPVTNKKTVGSSKIFKQDPEYYLLNALEIVDETKGTVKKADIFSVIRRIQKKEIVVNTPEDALKTSLNVIGYLDMDHIAELLKTTPEETFEKLKGFVFKNPEGGYEMADEYLSGNVRAKLVAAKEAANFDKTYEENVKALEQVQPKDALPNEIDAHLGSSWIPTDIIKQFIVDILQIPKNHQELINISFNSVTGSWKVDTGSAAEKRNAGFEENTIHAINTWGTSAKNAYDLLEDALNLRVPQIRVPDPADSTGKKTLLDIAATDAAVEKVRALKEKFSEWIWKDDERTRRITEVFNRDMNNTVVRSYKSLRDVLTFPGLNTNFIPRPHQKDGIARVIFGGNTLLAHGVGAGKTAEIVISAMELRRLGLRRKNMILCMDNMLSSFQNAFAELYPQAKVLFADEDDFNPQNIKQLFANIAANDWDAVVIRHSNLAKIPVSNQTMELHIQEQIDDVIQAIRLANEDKSKNIERQLQTKLKNLEAKMDALRNAPVYDGVTFEEMGIDQIFVDESQVFKNLNTTTKLSGIKGIQTEGNAMTDDLYMKIKYVRNLHGGKAGVVFATGTPVSNTLVEFYNLFKYLRPDILKERGLYHFDAWMGTFGNIESDLEIDETNTFKEVTRFRGLLNDYDVVTMFREFADVVLTKDIKEITLPELEGGQPIIIESPENPGYAEFAKELVKRKEAAIEALKQRDYSYKDGILKIYNDAKMAALDLRLVDPNLYEDFADSKINKAAKQIYEVWKETMDRKATQIVFINSGTSYYPDKTVKFDINADLLEKLVKMGIPRKEIALANTYKKEKRALLYAKMNSGDIRVLIGTNALMGTGLNVQERLFAIHEVDIMYRPSDLEQGEGREIRQGNRHIEWGIPVRIYRYIHEGSFDAVMWQMVESKRRAINKAMKGSPIRGTLKNVEEDETEQIYALTKAKALGDERYVEQADLNKKVTRLKNRYINYMGQQYMLRDIIQRYPIQVKNTEKIIKDIESDISKRQSLKGDNFSVKINGRTYTDREVAGNILKKIAAKYYSDNLKTYNAWIKDHEDRRNLEEVIPNVEIGTIGGFNVAMSYDKNGAEFTFLHRGTSYMTFGIEGLTPQGIWQRAEAVLNRLDDDLQTKQNELQGLKKDLIDAKEGVDKPFEGQEELDKLSERLRVLTAELKAERDRERVGVTYSSSKDSNNEDGYEEETRYSISKDDSNSRAQSHNKKTKHRSVRELTEEELNSPEIKAYKEKLWKELGKKSPFYKAEHGEWRFEDETPVIITKIDDKTIPDNLLNREKVYEWACRSDFGNHDSITGKPIGIRGEYKNSDTGWNIQLVAEGIGKSINNAFIHSVKNRSDEQLQLKSVATIPELIRNAIIVDTELNSNESEKDKYPFVHVFYAPVAYDVKDYIAQITVKESKAGRKFYSEYIIKADKSYPQTQSNQSYRTSGWPDLTASQDRPFPGTQSEENHRTSLWASLSNTTVAQLYKYVNPKHVGIFGKETRYSIAPQSTTQKKKGFTLSNPEAKQNYDLAHGLNAKTLWQKVKRGAVEFKNFATRTIRYIDEKDPYLAKLRFNLVNYFNKMMPQAKEEAIDLINSSIGKLSKEDFQTFEHYVFLLDLKETAEEGKPIMSGFTLDYVNEELDRLEKEYMTSEIKAAFDKRQNTWKKVIDNYVEAMRSIGINQAGKFSREHYYRHQVLDYYNEFKGIARGIDKLKNPNRHRGFTQHREGSELFINTNYLEAEFEVLSQMIYDTNLAKMVKDIKNNYDIASQLKKQAKIMNDEAVNKIIASEISQGLVDGKGRTPTQKVMMEFKKKLAYSFKQLEDIASNGSLWDGDNGEYSDVVHNIAIGKSNNSLVLDDTSSRMWLYLRDLASQPDDDPGVIQARTIFSAVTKRKQFVKDLLGEGYATWEKIIPRGYRKYVVDEQMYFYQTKTLSEQIADKLVSGMLKEYNVTEGDLKDTEISGIARKIWVVRDDVHTTLSNVIKRNDKNIVQKGWEWLNNHIKRWFLTHNPRRPFIYNIRNLFGDLDKYISVMGLKTLTGFKNYIVRATNELNNGLHKDNYTPDLLIYKKMGGLQSGQLNQEITDVNNLKVFKKFTHKKGIHPVKSVYAAVDSATEFRESILRYALYLYYKQDLDKNNGVPSRGYASSKMALVKGLNSNSEKAYQLSKDVMGAYDELSGFGQMMRKGFIPFYSWMEVNFKSYTRLFINNLTDKELCARVGGKVVGNVLGKNFKINVGRAALIGQTLLRVIALTAIMALFNQIFHHDDEDELSEDAKKTPHIILGRVNGKIVYLDRLGALNDFLEWFGLGDIEPAKNFLNGEVSFKEMIGEMAKQPANKVVQGINPFAKTLVEVAAMKDFYPDVFNPRAIRDKGTHIAGALGVEPEYREIAGLPSKKYLSLETLGSFFVKTSDPKQTAYYDVLDMKRRFEEKYAKKAPYEGINNSKKIKALYNYKLALKYGDSVAAKKYIKIYAKEGGTKKGLDQSLRMLHPLYGLDAKERRYFMLDLTEHEKKQVEMALEYYNDLMKFKGSIGK